MGVPLPALRTGDVGRRVQGGLPPVPYRNACSKWASCPTKWAREPFASKSIKSEVFHTTSEWDQSKRKGRGAWVAP